MAQAGVAQPAAPRHVNRQPVGVTSLTDRRRPTLHLDVPCRARSETMPAITSPTDPFWSVDIPVEQYEVIVHRGSDGTNKFIRLTSSRMEEAGSASILLAFRSDA